MPMKRVVDRSLATVLDRIGVLIGRLGLAAGFGISAGFGVLAAWGYLHHDAPFRVMVPTVFALLGAIGMLTWVLAKRDAQRPQS